MKALAKLLVRRPVAWAVVIVTVLVTVLAGWQATKVDQDDDVLKFLPRGNADVAAFRAINERFGGLDVAMVAIEAGDPFDAAFLGKLRALTKQLNEEKAIAYALSLANVDDFTPEKGGGIRADYLVSELPKNDADKAELRALVMSRDHIVGNLISADGKSVLIYNFGKHGTSPRELSQLVKKKVDAAFPDVPKYWGGQPFISTYIYDITQADMRKLTPWAILVKLIIVMLAFRSGIGVFLTVASAGFGIAIVEGLMGVTHTPANVVLGSLPVILFALGSAYATHVIVQYFAHRASHSADDAVTATLVDVGPPVLGAGLITAAGLFSFLAMDIGPLRQFGLFAGIGILVALVLSLTFVPAMLVLTRAGAKRLGGEGVWRRLGAFVANMTRQRKAVSLALAAVAAVGAFLTSRVDARMEASAFFAKGSPPAEAERFLRDRFGGSQFIQLAVDGNMNDPNVLREVQRLADEIALLPHVSSVTHIGQVLALTDDAMAGERRIPATEPQVRALYGFLAGRASVRQLVTDDHEHAVIIVKIDTDEHVAVGALLAEVERLAERDAVRWYRPRRTPQTTALDLSLRQRRVCAAEVRALLALFGIEPPGFERAFGATELLGDARPDQARAEKRVERYLTSDESVLEPEQRKHAAAIAAAVAPLGPKPDKAALEEAIDNAIKDANEEDLAEDLASSLPAALDEAWRHERADAAAQRLLAIIDVKLPEGDKGARLFARIADTLLDLDNDTALLAVSDPTAAPGSLTGADAALARIDYTVSGQPVLNRGLSQSVRSNQFKSLFVSLGLVLLIMIALYRSLSAGLLAVAPTALTLLVIYGSMKLIGLHLEVGTSMLACLVIGAGVDYGVHLLHGWRARDEAGTDPEPLDAIARRAAEHSGMASWTNAVMVSAGFLVLTLGQARPLQTVGGLTGAAMLTAALATFVVIPALARRRRYAGPAPAAAVPRRDH